VKTAWKKMTILAAMDGHGFHLYTRIDATEAQIGYIMVC
jgi:hypothetical protein